MKALSQVHIPEGLLGESFPVKRKYEEIWVDLLDYNGKKIPFKLKVATDHAPQRIEKLRKIMSKEDLCEWSFHGIPMYTVEAAKITRTLCDAAQRGWTLYDMPSGNRQTLT